MRRRAGVLGLVIAALLALWWWHGSRETSAPRAASKAAAPLGSARGNELAKTATLSGRVTRAKDGTPIAGAFVAIAAHGSPVLYVKPLLLTTARDGTWTTAIAAGTYEVGAAADGFIPEHHGPVVVAPHAVAHADIGLMEGGVSVRGVVSDIGGGPIAGARVSTFVNETYVATFTRADGTYRLTVEPGFRTLEFSHDDYVTASASFAAWTLDAVHDISLVPAGTIHGVVVAADTGKPVPDAIISVGANRARFDGEAETDGDGTFVLHAVSAGDIPLYANAPGYATTRPTVVNLGVGDAVEARLVADRAFTLRGRIVRKGHPTEGVAGVFVNAHTDAPVPDSRSRVATGADGAFEIVGLAPARYTLTATGHDILVTKSEVAVPVSRDLDKVQIEVTSGVTVRGRIDPPEKVELTFYAHNEYTAPHVTEDAAGAFVATNVPPGSADIAASSSTKQGDVSLVVGSEDLSGVVVALRPTDRKTISGTVVDEANTPIPHAYIAAGGESAFTGTDGSFELHASGVTRIYASFGVVDRHSGDRDPIMQVNVDKDIRGLIVKIPAVQMAIHGHVTGTDGKPAHDVWVRVSQASGEVPVLTGADGSFAIDHLRQGTYEVRAEAARGDATAVVRDVTAGSTIEIALQPTATLHGRVTMAGAPVGHYDLRCQGADYFERRIDAADGTFSIDHVRAVEGYPMECRAATEHAEGHALVSFAGGAAAVAIELTPFASITGTVLDVFSKQPMTAATVGLAGRTMHSLFGSPQPLEGNGRFAIDHVPVEEVRVQVMTNRTFATVTAHPIAGQTLELPPILMMSPPRVPVSLQIAVNAEMQLYFDPGKYPQLHAGDKLVAVDGIDVSVMRWTQWAELFEGNAERGHTYALALARGVTVNITAD